MSEKTIEEKFEEWIKGNAIDYFRAGYEVAQKELQKELDEAIKHIENLLKPHASPCLHDQENKCQEHENYGLESNCHVKDAKYFLKARGE